MRTTAVGREAEAVVARRLVRDGFVILNKNWRTRWCEIDVIAKKDKVVYFIEVKYRTGDSQGSGLDYITPHKLKRMGFAAGFWTSQNNWDGDYRMLGAEVTGSDFENIELVEIGT